VERDIALLLVVNIVSLLMTCGAHWLLLGAFVVNDGSNSEGIDVSEGGGKSRESICLLISQQHATLNCGGVEVWERIQISQATKASYAALGKVAGKTSSNSSKSMLNSSSDMVS